MERGQVHGRTGLWVVDDVPSSKFPIYTRGNTGEVYPNVITPLCGSIVKRPFDRGQERVFEEMGVLTRGDLSEGDRAVLTGCFGGYLYGNLSIGRLLGARAPGMKPEDADTQIFGTSDAPPYVRRRGDRNALATARMGSFMVRILRGPDTSWLDRERHEVATWFRALGDPRRATADQLFTTIDEGTARLADLMRSLLLVSIYGGIAAALTDRLTEKADVGTRAKLSVGVGNVESADAASELWRLAQLANAGPDDASGFRSEFANFLDRFGSRGPDEWELASHTWGTEPSIALAAIDRLRHSTAAAPDSVARRLSAERSEAIRAAEATVPAAARPMFRRAAATLAVGAAGREFAKGTLVLGLYGMRRALFELVRRAQDAGGPEERLDCWLVTRDELPTLLERPRELAEVIAERRGRRDVLQSRIPPFVFEGAIPDPSTWTRRDTAPLPTDAPGTTMSGLAVSPGVARGPARIIRDPADPDALQPGDVLVAPITDPAWTPLFLVASAVVCDVGANLSHAAIVARELGIPAVVSVDGATRRLRDGTLLEVDGTRGTVTVLAASEPPGSADLTPRGDARRGRL